MTVIPRLPIWLYISVGLLVLAVGWLFKMSIDLAEDSKAEALLLPAPEAVLLEEFDPERNIGAGNEVTIRAQLALDLTGRLSTIDGDEQRYGTFFGLFPVTSLDDRRSISAILLSEEIIIEQSYIDSLTVGNGPFGPIIEVNGAVGSLSNVQIQIDRNLEAVGRILPSDVLTIVPFFEGRDIALKPDLNKGMQVFTIFGLIGAIYIGYGILRWFLRRKQADHEPMR